MTKVYAVLLLVLLTSCRKDPLPVCFDVPAGVKEWTYFEEGSYWVFEQDTTGRRDSVYVVSAAVSDPFDQGEKASPYIFCHYESSLGYEVFDYVLQFEMPDSCTPCIGKTYPNCVSVRREMTDSITGEGELGLHFYYPVLPPSVRTSAVFSFLIDTFRMVRDTTIYIDGAPVECLKTTHSKYAFHGGKRATIFHAKNIGVVRMELQDEPSWQLVNYSINQNL